MDAANRQRIAQLNRRRWIVWTPLAFAFLASYFHRTATGVVADSLMRDFSIARAADIGGLASVYFYIYAVMQLPAGILADTFGPRRTVLLALLTATAGAVIFGAAQNIPMLYAGRILSSAGVSLIYISIVKIHAEWFRTREFTTMTGLIVVAGSSGFLLAATPLAWMVEWFGWRTSFYSIGAYTLMALIFCWFWVKDRPAELGLPSMAEVEAWEGTIKRNEKAVEPKPYNIKDNLKQVLGNPATWWPFLASVAIYGVYMAFMGLWAVPYLMQVYGFSRVTASSYVMAMSIGTLLGAPIIGVISDRLALRRLPNLVVSSGFLALWLVFTFWDGGKPPVWALYPICFGIGLGMSGNNLNVACGKEVTPPAMTGMVAGLVNAGSFVGGALMQPLFGWVLDRHWQGVMEEGVRIYPLEAYQQAFMMCAVVLGLGVLFTALIKETRGVNIHCQ
ncbi:MAG TPA: MFS transporter [Bacillota bacterium]|nr:MFS transporter [Bacillota bacterium]HPT86269.1 MFS transporter [Bacillota bacterium]